MTRNSVVVFDMGGPGPSFHFFDDRAENLSAALELGWVARQVCGVAAARAACRELGLLRA